MKKYRYLIIMLLLIFLLFNISPKKSEASDSYETFAYINVDSGKLLRDYTDKDIDDDLYRVRNKKFMGWNIYIFNDNVPTTFVKESLFSYKNEGSTPITYKVKVKSEKTNKTSVSVKGNIGLDIKGGGKAFKGDLNQELKLDGEYSEVELCQEESNLEITVDPNTMVVGSIEGTGVYTNGLACCYCFWIENQIGAFEYFKITSSYLRIEKLAL